MSRASFFYCHGTNYIFNIMVPFIGSIVSLDNSLVLRVRNSAINPNKPVSATIAGLNGKTYSWDLSPAADPFPTMLDPELWDERVMVAYPAQIILGGASIDYGRDRMIEKILAMPKGKKFAIGGFSQGAAVASGVYMSGLKPGTSGPLESRRADFLGATCFGNPRRQINHRGAGGQFGTFSGSWYDPDVDLGAGGCFPDTGPWGRLTGCEDKWVEFVAPGESITGNGNSLIEQRWQLLSGAFLGAVDVPAFVNAVTAELQQTIEVVSELLAGDGFGRILPNFFVDAAGALRDVGGGGHTHYAILPPPNAAGEVATTSQQINGVTYYTPVGDTSYQCALKFLNGLARDYQTAPLVVPPTKATGWSTTLIPPAS